MRPFVKGWPDWIGLPFFVGGPLLYIGAHAATKMSACVDPAPQPMNVLLRTLQLLNPFDSNLARTIAHQHQNNMA